MQSLIIVGKNTEELKKKALEICRENKISRFDVQVLQTEKAVGIGDIRKLQDTLILKPIESDQKAAILECFLGMTTESQNAFLKILEEPPANTIIILLSTSLDFFLPTVLSRCNLITLEGKENQSKEEIEENLRVLSSLRFPSNALIIAQDFSKDRTNALEFLEKMIRSSEDAITKPNLQEYFSIRELKTILKELQKTYTIIKGTNVNVRFALENLFLNLYNSN